MYLNIWNLFLNRSAAITQIFALPCVKTLGLTCVVIFLKPLYGHGCEINVKGQQPNLSEWMTPESSSYVFPSRYISPTDREAQFWKALFYIWFVFYVIYKDWKNVSNEIQLPRGSCRPLLSWDKQANWSCMYSVHFSYHNGGACELFWMYNFLLSSCV